MPTLRSSSSKSTPKRRIIYSDDDDDYEPFETQSTTNNTSSANNDNTMELPTPDKYSSIVYDKEAGFVNDFMERISEKLNMGEYNGSISPSSILRGASVDHVLLRSAWRRVEKRLAFRGYQCNLSFKRSPDAFLWRIYLPQEIRSRRLARFSASLMTVMMGLFTIYLYSFMTEMNNNSGNSDNNIHFGPHGHHVDDMF